MTLPFQLRPAVAEDAAKLAALAIQVWLHTYADQGISTPIADYVLGEFTAARFAEMIADPRWEIVVAEADGNLVAYAKLGVATAYEGYACEIDQLYVQAPFLRRGIGRVLLDHVAVAHPGGLWLTVNVRNANALAFYQGMGFIHLGETDFILDGVAHRNYILGKAGSVKK